MKAIERPSGEKNGLMSMPGSSVSRVSRPSATATVQMSMLPPRPEKNVSVRPSGAQAGW